MKHYSYRWVILPSFFLLLLAGCSPSTPHTTDTEAATIDPRQAAQQAANEQKQAEEQQQQRMREEYKTAITTLLQQDSILSHENKGNAAAIVAAMRRLNLSQCPEDFSVAYIDHIHAWDRAADIQQARELLSSDENVKKVAITTILEKILGSKSDALDDALDQENALKQADAENDQRIKATFEAVERLAVSYGATLPQS